MIFYQSDDSDFAVSWESFLRIVHHAVVVVFIAELWYGVRIIDVEIVFMAWKEKSVLFKQSTIIAWCYCLMNLTVSVFLSED